MHQLKRWGGLFNIISEPGGFPLPLNVQIAIPSTAGGIIRLDGISAKPVFQGVSTATGYLHRLLIVDGEVDLNADCQPYQDTKDIVTGNILYQTLLEVTNPGGDPPFHQDFIRGLRAYSGHMTIVLFAGRSADNTVPGAGHATLSAWGAEEFGGQESFNPKMR